MTRTKRAASPSSNGTTGTFNISTRYARETADVVLLDPITTPGQPQQDTGGRIRIKSVLSDEADEARDRFRSALEVAGGEVILTTEQKQDVLLEQTIAVTLAGGWWNLREGDGEGRPIPLDEANVRRVYTDKRTAWIYQQVLRDYLALARFFETGTPSS